MRLLLLVNPIAGRGRTLAAANRLRGALGRRGVAAELVVTQAPGDAERVAAASRSDVVVAVGGDGTASEAARGLAARGRGGALALLPLGTGNDLAAALGLRARDVTADRLLAGRSEPCDLGRVAWSDGQSGSRLFLNGLGIGFDAQVAGALPSRRRWGPLAYTAAALDAWFAQPARAPSVCVAADGRVLHEGALLMASVGNGDRQGGGFRFTPAARPDDGRLDVLCVAPPGLGRAVVLAARSRVGRHAGAAGVALASFERLELVSNAPLPLHADGDVLALGARAIQVDVVPGALTLWRPGAQKVTVSAQRGGSAARTFEPHPTDPG